MIHISSLNAPISGKKVSMSKLTMEQIRKNTANLQTWFGERLWPKIEEGLVVKNGILSCWHSSYKCRK